VIAEGDKVVGRNTVTGTHQGEYLGLPPTGKSVTYDEIFILRFAGGRIVETWGSSTSSRRCDSLAPSPEAPHDHSNAEPGGGHQTRWGLRRPSTGVLMPIG
jgi:hypothetical protein